MFPAGTHTKHMYPLTYTWIQQKQQPQSCSALCLKGWSPLRRIHRHKGIRWIPPAAALRPSACPVPGLRSSRAGNDLASPHAIVSLNSLMGLQISFITTHNSQLVNFSPEETSWEFWKCNWNFCICQVWNDFLFILFFFFFFFSLFFVALNEA